MRRGSLLAALAAGLTAPALSRAQAAPDPGTAANINTIGLLSGGLDGTYSRLAADIAAVLDDISDFRVLPILGKGSLQNLSDLLFLRGVDAAIVQSDVLAAAAQQRMVPGVEKKVHYISKLHVEEVHVFGGSGIERLPELDGKFVGMGGRGSGTAVTATHMFSRLGIGVLPVYAATEDAAEMLRRGDVAAMVRVTGKPARFADPLPEGVRLLPVPFSKGLLETYLPTVLTEADYPALIPPGEEVETVAVEALLVAYNHENAERREKLVRFARALYLRFNALQQPPRHPKWRNVNIAATVPGWTRVVGDRNFPEAPTQAVRAARKAVEENIFPLRP